MEPVEEEPLQIDNGRQERQCPFVSEYGPSCPLCGAPPTHVNLDEGGYGFCDDCGGRFLLER